MLMAVLLFIGAGIGIVIGALSNPMIYAALTGGREKSLDHEESDW